MVALTFPVPVDDFFAGLKIRTVKLTLLEFILTSGTEDNFMTAELAAPKWSAEITTAPMWDTDARRAAALLRRIGAHGRFFVYDKAYPHPRLDPDGSIVADYRPKVAQVGSSNREVRLNGLPPGYRLRWGDKVQITYGADPVRYMLLEVNEDVNCDTTGTTPLFEITPPLRPGIVAGNNVFMRRASCMMQFRSYDAGVNELHLHGPMTFQAVEVVT